MNNNINRNCKICGKKVTILCYRCNLVGYCSTICQLKDWNRHKLFCIEKNNSSNGPLNMKINEKNINNINDSNNSQFNFKNIDQSNSLVEQKYKVKKRVSNKKKNERKSIEKNAKVENFNFLKKFWNILYKIETNEVYMRGSNLSIKKNQSQKLYELLLEHRIFLKSKILINPNNLNRFKNLNFAMDTYFEIESYIMHFLLLIRFLSNLKDPINLVKADQTLKILGNELFIIKGSDKKGLLVDSINSILDTLINELQSKYIYQNLSDIYQVLTRFLSLLSSIMKISLFLEDSIIYQKAISFYDKIFNISLKFISSGKETEKKILKCNLYFNIANIFIKNRYINSGILLYKNVLQEQKDIDPCTFICGVVYYNISIIYYVMDKYKDCEFYLNEGIDKINKLLDSKKVISQIENFRKLIRIFLVFYAEIYLDKQKYDKTIQCLKLIIENMIDNNQNSKIKHMTQGGISEIPNVKALNQLKLMLKNYLKRNNFISPKLETRINKEEIKYGKSKNLSAYDILYETKFYSSKSEKAYFDEKMKIFINGLLEKIRAICIEREKKMRQKKKVTIKIASNDTDKKKKFIKQKTIITEKNMTEKEQNNVPDLSLQNIIKTNYTTDIDNSKVSRTRNKTVSKKLGKNFLNDREKEKEKEKKLENEKVNREKINEEKLNAENNSNNELLNLNEETTNKIISFLNDKMIRKKKLLDSEQSTSDFKSFFLLLTTLSIRQMEILNETQPKNVTKIKYENLPILFSKQFKNSLNPVQRNIINKIRILSLIRSKILKDSNLPITIDNLNFNIFKVQIKFDDFKIKAKDIPDIIEEMNRFQRNKKKEITIIPGNFRDKTAKKKSSLLPMILENKDWKDVVTNFINEKLKKLKAENDSETISGENSNYSESDYEFKYQNKYDINKLKRRVSEAIKFKKDYTEKEKRKYLEILMSNVFIQLMNCFDISLIKELGNNLDILLEFLKFFRRRFMKEIKLMKKIKNKDEFKGSDNSFSISYYEQSKFNIIKEKFDSDFKNVNINNSVDKILLGKKNNFLNSDDEFRSKRKNYYYKSNTKKMKKSKSLIDFM